MGLHPLLEIRKEIEVFDPADLMSMVAGLQLMPENADQSLRLEALAQVVASVPYMEGKPGHQRTRLRGICNGSILDTLTPRNPLNNPFTEAISFHGGSFVVFPGILDDAAYIFRQFIRGLFLGDPSVMPEGYAGRARRLVASTLAFVTK